MKKLNRGQLKRLINKGLVEGRTMFHYTDDYVQDAHNEATRGDGWLPVVKGTYDDDTNGKICIFEEELKYKGGGVRANDDGTYTLTIHSNLCYQLRVKEEV